jgi:hypothetical protein
VILQAGDRRVAIGVVDVAVVLGAGLAGRLADAVEVLALGAVLPVLALGAAEFGRTVDRRHVVAAVAAAFGRPLGLALAGTLGARQSLRQRLERRRGLFLSLEEGFCSSICSTSWWSSSVESCSSRIDCCSWGVRARCCESRTCRDGFIAVPYIRKFSPR